MEQAIPECSVASGTKKSELEINNMIFGHIDSTLHDHRRTYSNFLTAN